MATRQDSGDFDDSPEPDDGDEFDRSADDVVTAVGKKNPLVPQPISQISLPFSEDDFEKDVVTQVKPC